MVEIKNIMCHTRVSSKEKAKIVIFKNGGFISAHHGCMVACTKLPHIFVIERNSSLLLSSLLIIFLIMLLCPSLTFGPCLILLVDVQVQSPWHMLRYERRS